MGSERAVVRCPVSRPYEYSSARREAFWDSLAKIAPERMKVQLGPLCARVTVLYIDVDINGVQI